jgi:hypothetical protein
MNTKRKRLQERPAPIKFRQRADGSWESYRSDAEAPKAPEPVSPESGSVFNSVKEQLSKAGSAISRGAMRRLNTAKLEQLAERHGVDISKATTNRDRADLIYDHIKAKKDC